MALGPTRWQWGTVHMRHYSSSTVPTATVAEFISSLPISLVGLKPISRVIRVSPLYIKVYCVLKGQARK
jgi:hypothetical protein